MNIYITVEGVIGEAKVYQHWVPLVNPELSFVQHIDDINENNFFIISGGGYPNYYKVIDSAIDDVETHTNIDRLVIAIDSEDMDYQDKLNEVRRHTFNRQCRAEVRIIIQHFCLETWALGNQVIIRPQPQCPILRKYIALHNVRTLDPELLPRLEREDLNRAQFAEKYLRRALNDKYKNLTYSKSNPDALLHRKYFERVKQRLFRTGHIPSFQAFIEAFV